MSSSRAYCAMVCKYGGLDLMHFLDGPCPRFGSCHLRSRPAVSVRSTFSFGDSVLEPVDLGTLDIFEPLLAAMLETAETTEALLGRAQATVRDVVDLLVPAEFRGPVIPLLAEQVARSFAGGSASLDAEIIGQAARSVVTDPVSWSDWASPADTLQQLKQLWHVLVRFGAPVRT
jgi:hypothetical protein